LPLTIKIFVKTALVVATRSLLEAVSKFHHRLTSMQEVALKSLRPRKIMTEVEGREKSK
jgi:hypothetical protein